MAPYSRDSQIPGRTCRSISCIHLWLQPIFERKPSSYSFLSSSYTVSHFWITALGNFRFWPTSQLAAYPFADNPPGQFSLRHPTFSNLRALLDAVALCDSIRSAGVAIHQGADRSAYELLYIFVRQLVAICQFVDWLLKKELPKIYSSVHFWTYLPGWRITHLLDRLNFEYICIPILGTQLLFCRSCCTDPVHKVGPFLGHPLASKVIAKRSTLLGLLNFEHPHQFR